MSKRKSLSGPGSLILVAGLLLVPASQRGHPFGSGDIIRCASPEVPGRMCASSLKELEKRIVRGEVLEGNWHSVGVAGRGGRLRAWVHRTRGSILGTSILLEPPMSKLIYGGRRLSYDTDFSNQEVTEPSWFWDGGNRVMLLLPKDENPNDVRITIDYIRDEVGRDRAVRNEVFAEDFQSGLGRWDLHSSSGEVKIRVRDADGRRGEKVLAATTGRGATGSLETTVVVLGKASYLLELYVRNNSPRVLEPFRPVLIEEVLQAQSPTGRGEEGGTTVLHDDSPFFQGTPREWRRITYMLSTHENTRALTIRLQFGEAEERAAEILYDDIRLRKAQNVMDIATFDDGGSEGWRLRSWSGTSYGGVGEARALSGRKGLFLMADDWADAGFEKHYRVEPSRTYSFIGYLFTESLKPEDLGKKFGSFYLMEFDYINPGLEDGNDPIEVHNTAPNHKGDSLGWSRVVIRIHTRPETRMLRVGAFLGAWGRAKGKVFFDNLILIREPRDPLSIMRRYIPPAAPGRAPGGQGSTPVILQRVSLGGETRPALFAPTNTMIRYRIEVPARAVLEFAIGLLLDTPRLANRRTVFMVKVAASNREEERVFRERLPWNEAGLWHEYEVDLSRFAGKRIVLTFETEGEVRSPADSASSSGPETGYAVWGGPIVCGAGRERPDYNIVLFLVDTLRADHLGCYGYARNVSPNIDELASRSVVFHNATSQAGWTLPSVASLLTSQYPSTNGVLTANRRLSDGLLTVAEALREVGYYTIAFTDGNFVSAFWGFDQGFDQFHEFTYERWEPDLGRVDVQEEVDKAVRWLASNREKRFFLFLHTYQVHDPYTAPPAYTALFADRDYTGSASGSHRFLMKHYPKEVPLGEKDLRHIISLYDAEIRYTDDAFGRLLDALRRLDLLKTTLIVFTSDHGEEFKEHGQLLHMGSIYDEIVQVPLIIKLPPNMEWRAGEDYHQVELIDVIPTLFDALGMDSSAYPFQGRSLLRLRGDGVDGQGFAFIEGDTELKGIRGGGMKFIARVREGRLENGELYDLRMDPRESMNVIRSRPVAGELYKHLLQAKLSDHGLTPRGPDRTRIPYDLRRRLESLGYLGR